MSTITLTRENFSGVREVIISLITSFIRAVQHFINAISTADINSREKAELEKAVRTVQLAAEPGENYAEVAAKVRKEAEIYRQFLQHPQPIGRILLYVKELDSREPDFGKPRTQWLVDEPSEGGRDPIEGRASVSYRLSRSATRVLEFMIHDHNDVPLFAIARAYTNWLGKKTFDLGPNRVFSLEMTEELPGYVDVKIGFKPAVAFEDDTEDVKVREFPQPVPIPAVTETRPEPHSSIFRNPFVFTAQCAVISIIASSLACVAVVRAIAKAGSPVDSEVTVSTPVAESRSLPSANFVWNDTSGAALKDFRIGETLVFNPELKTVRIRSVEKSKRLAEVKSFSISVDNSSCKQMESQCRVLLSTVQQEVKSNLNSLNVPVLNMGHARVGKEPAKLVVSYNPINLLHGQIHLTLYDKEGALWNGNGNLSYAQLTKPDLIKSYCEEASSEIVWEIIMAKAHLNSDHDAMQDRSTDSE